MVGSIALGLNLTDYVAQGAGGSPIAIIFAATGLGQVTAMIFALRAGESAVASVFGIFAGFWLSYSALVLGLNNGWYGAPTEAAAVDTVKTFLLSWLILIVILTLVSLRLPAAFTLLFVLVDFALFFVLLAWGNLNKAGAPDPNQLKIGGYLVFSFVAVGAYLFADAFSAATGGKNYPLGPPILK